MQFWLRNCKKLPHRKQFFGLGHSWLMDLGHIQQHHPTVYSRGVSRVPCRSPTPLLPLTFRSPSAPLPLPYCFLWTLFVDTFCGHFFGHFLWTLIADTLCGHFLLTLFVDIYIYICRYRYIYIYIYIFSY